jgi:hypothetical protein
MSSEDFFNNALKCEYNHDYLHTFLKNPPTYTKVLKDGAEVDVSETKFNNLSFEEKCDLVKEEVMVMAFERYSKFYYRNAYAKMMKKFIISHAPMWEAIFIIENYMSVYKPDYNFLKKIENSILELKQLETVNE